VRAMEPEPQAPQHQGKRVCSARNRRPEHQQTPSRTELSSGKSKEQYVRQSRFGARKLVRFQSRRIELFETMALNTFESEYTLVNKRATMIKT